MASLPGQAGAPHAAADHRSPHRRSASRVAVGGVTAAMVAAMLTSAAAFGATGAPAPAAERVGAAPTAPKGAVKTADPADSTPLNLSITLSPRNPGALQSFVTAVSTKGSPQYHKYLKTGEFAQTFGADPTTVAGVTKALTAAGLHPGKLGSDGLTIPVTSTVAEAKRVFDTGFTGYKLADGSTAYANSQAPKLPAQLAGVVSGVVGMDNLYKPHAHHVVSGQPSVVPSGTTGKYAPRFSSSQPTICSNLVNFEQTKSRSNYQNYYSADALAQVYNVPFSNGAAGTTVAMFELEEYSDAAITAYQNCYGTQTPVSRVKVDGGPTTAPAVVNGSFNGVGVETALDIETVIGLAPNANVLVYQGPDAANASDAQVLDVYRQIVNDNKAQVVSTSWGLCEPNGASATMQAENLIFQQAAAQGQTVVAAAGDSGSTDCWNQNNTAQNSVATDDPASQPYVTGVGGTTMTGNSSNVQQKTWNHDNGAGGGGVSSVWQLDSATGFQAGITGQGYSNACTAAAGKACRQVPDVSALADPANGYLTAVYADNNGPLWGPVGGTSGAAPLWAAIAAEIDASAQCAATGPIGYLNPSLYKLKSSTTWNDGSPLHDVVTGTNDLAASGYTGGLYAAGTGYDLATGLGTPNGNSLLGPLCAAAPASPAGTYKPTTPTRLLDTRSGGGPVPAYGVKTLQVTGQAGVPASGVTAVVLNVTVTNTTTDGHLTVYPSNGAQPSTSNLNWTAGTTIPNLVTVPVGADGAVKLYNGTWGSTDLIADVQGYYVADTSGATYLPSGPTRILDTRSSAAVAAYGTQTLNISGQAGAPAGVNAVVLNVTVTNTTTDGHLTVYPSGVTQPTASNLNWTAGETIPNQVIVPVGADGSIKLYNGTWGSTDLIVDVFGYLVNGTSGASFHSATPHRILDSRTGIGTAASSFPGYQTRTLTLAGPLATAKAVVLNVTVTNTADAGHLTVYPTGQTAPNTSNLNWTGGQTIPNMVTVPVGPGGQISIANGSWAGTDVIVDVFGYYN